MVPGLQKGIRQEVKGVIVTTSLLKPKLFTCAKRVLAELVNPAKGLFEIVDDRQRKWEFRISQNARPGDGYLVKDGESLFEDSSEYANMHCLLRPRSRRCVRRLPSTPQGKLAEGTAVNYRKLHELARGSFGQVWKVLNIDRNELVAVKEQDTDIASVEAAVMRVVGEHRNIVHLIEGFQKGAENVSWLVLPLAESSLLEVMKRPLTKWDFCSFIKQIAMGVEHIHGKDLVHCDIKPDNILTFPGNGEELSFNLKIGDVGSARYVGSSFSEHYLCTRWYRAPEILLGAESARKPWDIWSVGTVAQEILYQRGPFLQGLNGVDQLKLIFAMNGPCSEQDWNAMVNDEATAHVGMNALPQWSAEERAEHMLQCKDLKKHQLCRGGDLWVQKCLKYNPKERLTASRLVEFASALKSELAQLGVV